MKYVNAMGAFGMTVFFGILNYTNNKIWIIPVTVSVVIYLISMDRLEEKE
mgnify:CR=1 FL=1